MARDEWGWPCTIEDGRGRVSMSEKCGGWRRTVSNGLEWVRTVGESSGPLGTTGIMFHDFNLAGTEGLSPQTTV